MGAHRFATAVRRWQAESLRRSPFVNVRNVQVQHLPGHMTGSDPLLLEVPGPRDFYCVADVFSEMPGRVLAAHRDKNHAGDEEKGTYF